MVPARRRSPSWPTSYFRHSRWTAATGWWSAPDEAGLPDEADGAPLLAVLSTMVVEEDIREATGALTVGIIEDEDDLDTRAVAPGIRAPTSC